MAINVRGGGGIPLRGSSSGGGGSLPSGGIWCSDATQSGGTFINNIRGIPAAGEVTEIIMITTDAPTVNLVLIGDRSVEYEPIVLVNGISATRSNTNSQRATDTGTFLWTVSIPIADTISIVMGKVTKSISVLREAPAIVRDLVIVNNVTSADFYPTTQTEVKSTDPIFISFNTDKLINQVTVSATGAGASQIINITPTMSVVNLQVTCGSISIVALLKSISINTRTTASSVSTIPAVTSNQILCNNTHPTIVVTNKVYPVTQTALKDNENVTLHLTLADIDTLLVNSPNNQLSISDTTTIEPTKVVTRISGDYNVSTTNVSFTGNRIANGSTTVTNGVVFIANAAPTITVSEPSPMKGGGNDGTSLGNYTVTISSTQRLLNTPTLSAPVGTLGTFSFSNTTTTFISTISVSDNDVKGTYNWLGLTATGMSGILVNSITGEREYTLAGIKSRVIVVPPFGSTITVHANINNPQNINVTWDFTGVLTYNVNDVLAPNNFTIINITANTFDIKLLDAPMVAASSQASSVTVG